MLITPYSDVGEIVKFLSKFLFFYFVIAVRENRKNMSDSVHEM